MIDFSSVRHFFCPFPDERSWGRGGRAGEKLVTRRVRAEEGTGREQHLSILSLSFCPGHTRSHSPESIQSSSETVAPPPPLSLRSKPRLQKKKPNPLCTTPLSLNNVPPRLSSFTGISQTSWPSQPFPNQRNELSSLSPGPPPFKWVPPPPFRKAKSPWLFRRRSYACMMGR